MITETTEVIPRFRGQKYDGYKFSYSCPECGRRKVLSSTAPMCYRSGVFKSCVCGCTFRVMIHPDYWKNEER